MGGSNGVSRETRARSGGSKSPRKTIAEILGCRSANTIVLDGSRHGRMTLKVEQGKARRVPGRPAIEYTGTAHELISHAAGLVSPPDVSPA